MASVFYRAGFLVTAESSSPNLRVYEKPNNRAKAQGYKMASKILFERYGNNEPYTEPERPDWNWSYELLCQLMTGPSTNFYVGPQETHYTIPKRLFYHFSDYAKPCLEGSFSEAGLNAIWLPDVEPDVFNGLWHWLYSGEVKIHRPYGYDWDLHPDERHVKECQALCRLYVLGERLLFDRRLLMYGIQMTLEDLFEEVKVNGHTMPLSPVVVEEVLLGTAPVPYGSEVNFDNVSLIPFVLTYLCTFRFCTTVDFMDYVYCFEKDGGFAAEILIFIASEIKWARDRCEAQIGWPMGEFEDENQITKDQDLSPSSATGTGAEEGIWFVLRCICTSAAGTTSDLRDFSNLLEAHPMLAANFLNHMVTELLWTVEQWGEERGEKVDFEAEKAEEERIEQEKRDLEHMVEKIMRRQAWSMG